MSEANRTSGSEAPSEWQPIETAPLDGTPLLLYAPGMNDWNRISGMPDIVVGLWRGKRHKWDGSMGWYCDAGYVDGGYESTGSYFVHEPIHPTHWMPLPAPPKVADSGCGPESP